MQIKHITVKHTNTVSIAALMSYSWHAFIHGTDANSELQRYTAELQDRAPLQAQAQRKLECHSVRVGSRVQLYRLSRVALDIMACPASQAYVERLFSLCGDLTARKRMYLKMPTQRNFRCVDRVAMHRHVKERHEHLILATIKTKSAVPQN